MQAGFSSRIFRICKISQDLRAGFASRIYKIGKICRMSERDVRARFQSAPTGLFRWLRRGYLSSGSGERELQGLERVSVRAQAIARDRGCLIKVLAVLEKGERRFSIDMQVLTDLKRVSI